MLAAQQVFWPEVHLVLAAVQLLQRMVVTEETDMVDIQGAAEEVVRVWAK